MPLDHIEYGYGELKVTLRIGDEITWNYPTESSDLLQYGVWYKVVEIKGTDFRLKEINDWWYFNTDQFSVRSSVSKSKIDYLSINRQMAGG